MGRRILNRKDMRADFDAAEKRKEDEERDDEDEDDEDEDAEGEDDESEDDEAEGDEDEGDEDDDEHEGDEDDEDRPRKKKKKVAKPKPVKEPKKTRSRAAKVVRQRVVWGVFNNSHQCVATYEYPRKTEAVQHAARLMQDKKSTHFVQPVKEPWEDREKKEDKKEKAK